MQRGRAVARCNTMLRAHIASHVLLKAANKGAY